MKKQTLSQNPKPPLPTSITSSCWWLVSNAQAEIQIEKNND